MAPGVCCPRPSPPNWREGWSPSTRASQPSASSRGRSPAASSSGLAWGRSTRGGSATSGEPDLEAVDAADPDAQAPHPLGPRDVIEALAAYSKVILTAVVVVTVAVGAYLLGRARAPEILRSPSASTGVLWACSGELVGAVGLDPGPVRITTTDGEVLQATVGDHGIVAVPAPMPARSGGRARVRRGGTELEVPVLTCAERPFEDRDD